MEQNNKPNIIPFNKIANIKKGIIGYIDKEGNFYPISEIEQNDYWLGKRKELTAGINAKQILLSLSLTNEEKVYYQNIIKVEGHEKGFFPWNWSAHQLLIKKGFCLFFRGIDDEQVYVDYSEYNNATENQLLVLDYLYSLNPPTSTDEIEKKKDIKNRILSLHQNI